MRGLRVRWELGPRSIISSTDRNGREVIRLGKNGGPVVEQAIVKVFEPKVAR